MAKKMMTNGMTAADRVVAWAMMTGLATALFQTAQLSALPAHFV